MIEHQLTAFKLRNTVTHQQGGYSALIADTITRYKAGKPVFYYTWTPYWVGAQLKPGTDVVWLKCLFPRCPVSRQNSTPSSQWKELRFRGEQAADRGQQGLCGEKSAAGKLFEVMKLSISDINAQNNRMAQGENTAADITRHTEGWIKAPEGL